MKTVVNINNSRLCLLNQDITEMEVDAIVNAANKYLQLGGGVAGAIRKKGGAEIQKECDKIGGTYVGGAIITTGGNLPAKKVIHAVGPKRGEGDEDNKLRNATLNSLKVAEKNGLKSIAFPAISTGIYGYPVKKCAEIMLGVIVDYLNGSTQISEVNICLWGDENLEIFKAQLEKILHIT